MNLASIFTLLVLLIIPVFIYLFIRAQIKGSEDNNKGE